MFTEEKDITSSNANNSTESSEIQTIQLNDITELRTKLRQLDKGWAKLLSEKMDTDVVTVYNIVNNKVYSNQWRVGFVLKGNELLAELMDKQTEALNLTNTNS